MRHVDKSLHIRLKLVSHWLIRSVIVIANAVVLSPSVFILLNEPLRGLPIVLLNIGLWLYYLGRVTLWDLFGQEEITINRNALSYQRSYGFIRARRYTFAFPSEIRIGFHPDSRYLGPQFGRLAFYTCTGQSSTRSLIMQSAIAVPRSLAPAVQFRVLRFFQPELFRPLSMN